MGEHPPDSLARIAEAEALARRQAEIERESSVGAYDPSNSSDVRARIATLEAMTSEPGDDYEGQTANERACIAFAEAHGVDLARRVRRQLHIRDGLRRIEDMQQWADQQQALTPVVMPLPRRLPRHRERRGRCGRPGGRRATRTARGSPGDDGGSDPEPSGLALARTGRRPKARIEAAG